jgi:FtsP/CotA-like multicopper oxidase with cupredoxin domain
LVRNKEADNFRQLIFDYLGEDVDLIGEKAELVFIANNPGAWLFHCHMLEHHAAGMGGVIYIS